MISSESIEWLDEYRMIDPSEVQVGDVLYFEYGDFDHYVTFGVQEIEPNGHWLDVTGQYIDDSYDRTMTACLGEHDKVELRGYIR